MPTSMLVFGGIASFVFGADADHYADVPVSKALATSTSGGLFLSQNWGWNMKLSKWAQDPQNTRKLFDWALERAQTAVKTKIPIEKIKEIQQEMR